MRKKHMWWIAPIGILLLAGALYGPIVSNVEQPKYKVVKRDRNIEIRDYPSMIVAQVDVSGERDPALREGFRQIANYIFGNNLSSRKVAMTAPVTQQASQKIAMTAPVTQQGNGNNWQVRFVMPAKYTIQTLPKPNNPSVKLEEIKAKRFAVIRFSGLAGKASLDRHTGELEAYLRSNHMKALGAPTYAFYNPPWTLPFLRRNEIMIEVAR
ncbi:MAG: SOUL family heme-binding protein [Acidobacteriaceae bacterium]